MTEEVFKLKIKKIEKKIVWTDDIDGEEMWVTDLHDKETGMPKMKITTTEKIEGFNKGDYVEVKLINPQRTLKDK